MEANVHTIIKVVETLSTVFTIPSLIAGMASAIIIVLRWIGVFSSIDPQAWLAIGGAGLVSVVVLLIRLGFFLA